MIKNIREFSKEDLFNWLKSEAGVNNKSWFSTDGIGHGVTEGNLELQQVAEEYVEYLWFLKEGNFKSYLNIGVGNGGSFLTETYIQESLDISVAVDNSSYSHNNQKLSIYNKINWMNNNLKDTKVEFHDSDSFAWLNNNKDRRFDVIFIDGDHSYEGVKRDYINSLPLLNSGGYIIFHDISSKGCPGVVNIWKEIKNNNCIEFIQSDTCGIGIWRDI